MRSNKILNLKNGVATVLGAATMAVTNCMPAFAAASTGVPEVDNGLNIIKALCIGVCAAIGVVGLVKGGIDFSSGISQRSVRYYYWCVRAGWWSYYGSYRYSYWPFGF